jgi:hypothetical protein
LAGRFLDKWGSGNYFLGRNLKKGVMEDGKGINYLETVYGVDPF